VVSFFVGRDNLWLHSLAADHDSCEQVVASASLAEAVHVDVAVCIAGEGHRPALRNERLETDLERGISRYRSSACHGDLRNFSMGRTEQPTLQSLPFNRQNWLPTFLI
jgi:hypothetical protein